MTRLEFIECLKTVGACQESLHWLRRQRGSPQQLVLRARSEWCAWLARRALPNKVGLDTEEFRCAVYYTNDVDPFSARVMADEFCRAYLLDMWSQVEKWLRAQ